MNKVAKSKKRIIAGISIVLVLTGLMLVLVNGSFLEGFFVRQKISAMQEAYTRISESASQGTIDSAEFDLSFRRIVEKNNVDIVIVDTDTETVKALGNDTDKLSEDLLRYIFRLSQNLEDTLMLKRDSFEVHRIKEARDGLEYLDLYGMIDSSKFVLVRSPMESISAAADVASVLFNYIIIIVAALGLSALLIADRADTIRVLRQQNLLLEKDIRQKEELEAMRSEFVSNVSHELKTPIALVQGYAEGLLDGIGDDEDSRNYYCSVIVDEASKMNAIVKKLLDLNQLEFGEVSFQPEGFDLTQLLSESLEANRILYEGRNIEVKLEAPPHLYAYADEYYVQEVFGNYLSNALNHVSNDKKIEICAKISDNRIVVSVFNTGDPIPEASLPHLFEKFYKVDKARTREYGGSGVGLSIVKAILDAMKESYGVENAENGVIFFFTLPIGQYPVSDINNTGEIV